MKSIILWILFISLFYPNCFAKFSCKSGNNFLTSNSTDNQGGPFTEKKSEESSPIPLEIFLLPHSHNDPGWWYSADKYYETWTSKVLSSVITALSNDPLRKFVWIEISLFSKWWEEQSDHTRNIVRRLIDNGQFEFATGGWVMTDEASPHYIDILNQLVEGNIWLKSNLNFTTKYGYAIDPFGHSPTIPYLLEQAQFEGMLINRVSEDIKESRGSHRELEFFWKQPFNNNFSQSHNTGLLTHMLNKQYYDIPNSVGTDWNTCATFDFERDVSKPITKENIKERASTLVQELKKKATKYRTPAVLVLYGDDFKYKYTDITEKMFSNMEKLISYINNHSAQFGMSLKWATLSEYFQRLNEYVCADLQEIKKSPEDEWPTFTGDFFPYTDRGNQYWTGYYTTRPFQKRLSRYESARLRGLEALYSLAEPIFQNYEENKLDPEIISKLTTIYNTKLKKCARDIGLFQHHDAITGTNRVDVNFDYTQRLLRCEDLNQAWSYLVPLLLSKDDYSDFVLPDVFPSMQIPKKTQSQISKKIPYFQVMPIPLTFSFEGPGENGFALVLFNPLLVPKNEYAHVRMETPFVNIIDGHGNTVPSQAVPVFRDSSVFVAEYDIFFPASVPPLGFLTLFLVKIEDTAHSLPTTNIEIYYSNPKNQYVFLDFDDADSLPFNTTHHSISTFEGTNLFNGIYTVNVDKRGFLVSVQASSIDDLIEFNQEYYVYSNYPRTSGAYIFESQKGDPKLLFPKSFVPEKVKVIKGVLFEEIRVQSNPLTKHFIRIFKPFVTDDNNAPLVSPMSQSIQLSYSIHLQEVRDFSLVARFKTNLNSRGEFFTDSNSMLMLKRFFNHTLKMAANYYPISSAFLLIDSISSEIQNPLGRPKHYHLNVFTAQALGGTTFPHVEDSEKKTVLEFMLDRALSADDGRGLGEGVLDNTITPITFWLTFEGKDPSIMKRDDSSSNDETNPFFEGERLKEKRRRNLFREMHPYSNEFNTPLQLLIAPTRVIQSTEEILIDWLDTYSLDRKFSQKKTTFPSCAELLTIKKSYDFEVEQGIFLQLRNVKSFGSCLFPIFDFIRDIIGINIDSSNSNIYLMDLFKNRDISDTPKILSPILPLAPMEIKAIFISTNVSFPSTKRDMTIFDTIIHIKEYIKKELVRQKEELIIAINPKGNTPDKKNISATSLPLAKYSLIFFVSSIMILFCIIRGYRIINNFKNIVSTANFQNPEHQIKNN